MEFKKETILTYENLINKKSSNILNKNIPNETELIIKFKMYLNTINHKCITNSCKLRHEIVIGDLLKAIEKTENMKLKKI
tara:strand:- start:3915 stop:4154 length:240 start_codon:yes stop_codon:yes gene_type:complete